MAVAALNQSGRGTEIFAASGDWLLIGWGWGFAVAFAVYVAGGISGAHINPAVTLAFAARRGFPWRKVPGYIAAQVVGAFLGALLVYIVYTRNPLLRAGQRHHPRRPRLGHDLLHLRHLPGQVLRQLGRALYRPGRRQGLAITGRAGYHTASSLFVIFGLILALASAVATNLAFLFKHRGAVLAPPDPGGAIRCAARPVCSAPNGSRSAGPWRSWPGFCTSVRSRWRHCRSCRRSSPAGSSSSRCSPSASSAFSSDGDNGSA
jgi:hypothetical protein